MFWSLAMRSRVYYIVLISHYNILNLSDRRELSVIMHTVCITTLTRTLELSSLRAVVAFGPLVQFSKARLSRGVPKQMHFEDCTSTILDTDR